MIRRDTDGDQCKQQTPQHHEYHPPAIQFDPDIGDIQLLLVCLDSRIIIGALHDGPLDLDAYEPQCFQDEVPYPLERFRQEGDDR